MSGITNYLQVLVKHDGSDLYLSTGAPPSAKFNGELKPLAKQTLPPGVVKKLAYELMNEDQTDSKQFPVFYLYPAVQEDRQQSHVLFCRS